MPNRKLEIVGINGIEMAHDEIDKVINDRRMKWKKPEFKNNKGVLSFYRKLAVSPMKGAYME